MQQKFTKRTTSCQWKSLPMSKSGREWEREDMILSWWSVYFSIDLSDVQLFASSQAQRMLIILVKGSKDLSCSVIISLSNLLPHQPRMDLFANSISLLCHKISKMMECAYIQGMRLGAHTLLSCAGFMTMSWIVRGSKEYENTLLFVVLGADEDSSSSSEDTPGVSSGDDDHISKPLLSWVPKWWPPRALLLLLYLRGISFLVKSLTNCTCGWRFAGAMLEADRDHNPELVVPLKGRWWVSLEWWGIPKIPFLALSATWERTVLKRFARIGASFWADGAASKIEGKWIIPSLVRMPLPKPDPKEPSWRFIRFPWWVCCEMAVFEVALPASLLIEADASGSLRLNLGCESIGAS